MIGLSNDRHGELENETAAIGWLFNNRDLHMRNLAKDILESAGKTYDSAASWGKRLSELGKIILPFIPPHNLYITL